MTPQGPDFQAPTRKVLRNRIDRALPVLDAVVLFVVAVITDHDNGTRGWIAILLGVPVTVLVLEAAGLYRRRITLSSLDDLPRLASWSIITTGVIVVATRPGVSIVDAAAHAGLVFVALFVVRTAYYAVVRRRRRSPAQRMRTMVVGDGIVAADLITSSRALPELGIDVVLAASKDPMAELVNTGVSVEDGVERLRDKVTEHRIDTVIVAFSGLPDSRLVGPLRACDELDCEIFIVPRLFEFASFAPNMDRIHTIPLIRVRRDARRTWYWKLKRVFDVSVVSVALVLLSPLLGLTALGVWLSDSSAPILFRQNRIGRDGRSFDVLKFRSMRPVPERSSDSEWQPSNADRIFPFGKFIRKTSLDELPQLWNVLRGDMSIVGPRPERPHFVEQFEQEIPSYRDRHRVEVGLTGWAAIHGLRGDTSITDRALYDNFYIESWSVWLDIKIIIRTVGAVLRGEGG
ncbi:MAG: exopolysaccharide biosynthesis polyprenyl glycosylphosphotransferase [Gordonia sp. (in: high G+C Gram-positive bacteria)]